MVKPSIAVLVFSLSVVSWIGLNGWDLQDILPKALKEVPQLSETAVGEMARGAIGETKGVETTLGETGNRIAESSQEGSP